jgi:hypothetical protein
MESETQLCTFTDTIPLNLLSRQNEGRDARFPPSSRRAPVLDGLAPTKTGYTRLPSERIPAVLGSMTLSSKPFPRRSIPDQAVADCRLAFGGASAVVPKRSSGQRPELNFRRCGPYRPDRRSPICNTSLIHYDWHLLHPAPRSLQSPDPASSPRKTPLPAT